MDLPSAARGGAQAGGLARGGPRPPVAVLAPTDEEAAAHRAYLEALDAASRGNCVWLALERESGQAA
jgi:hypothetical protein